MKRRIDDLLSSSLFLKIVSVALAIFLWMYASGDRNKEKTFFVPVEYRNVPEGIEVTAQTEEVEVQVSAPPALLSSLNARDIICEVDLRGLKPPSRHRLPIKISLPPGFSVVSVRPSYIEVELHRVVERVMSIEVEIANIPEGYIVHSVNAVPDKVVVKGREELITKVTGAVVRLPWEKVSSGESARASVELKAQGEIPSGLTIDPSWVNISVSAEKGFPRKEVPVEVQLRGAPDPDFTVESIVVVPGRVTLEGPPNVLSGITSVKTAPVSVEGLSKSEERTVTLEIPKGVSLQGEGRVKVKIELRERTVSRTFFDIPVKIAGKGIYSKWRLDPDRVNIVLEGPPSVIEKLNPKELPIEVYVDTSNVVSKQISTAPKVRLQGVNVRVLKIEPPQVMLYADD
jgi:YbbR domain-containing protein